MNDRSSSVSKFFWFHCYQLKVKGVGDVERKEEERVESHTWEKTEYFVFRAMTSCTQENKRTRTMHKEKEKCEEWKIRLIVDG